jgi:hypothetical protein
MLAVNARDEFDEYVAAAGLSLDGMMPVEATEIMQAFYAEVRADDCDMDADGDMLLFQWGVYDWGEGELFEYNITRQMTYTEMAPADPEIADDEEYEESVVGQLGLTLKYAPTAALRAVAEGNRWCSRPEQLPAFRQFVAECEASKAVLDEPVLARELRYGDAE